MASQTDENVAARFPSFMALPIDIRRHLYRMVLPCQDVPMGSGDWAKMTRIPNEFMNLLLTNKQVSDEARQVLYGSSSFTIAISAHGTGFLNSVELDRVFRPFKTVPPLIKNWQLRVGFRSPCDMDTLDHDGRWIREGLLTVSAELAKVPDLRTLKVSIPCLCGLYDYDEVSTDDVYKALAFSLEPLQQLRFQGGVRFIARVSTGVPRQDLVVFHLYSSAKRNTQCKEPACLALASSLASKKYFQGVPFRPH